MSSFTEKIFFLECFQVTSVFIFAILLTVFVGMLIKNSASLCFSGAKGYSQTSTSDEAQFLPTNSSTHNVLNVERG